MNPSKLANSLRVGRVQCPALFGEEVTMLEYVADFETTACRVYDIETHLLSRKYSETWVCAWALIPVDADPTPDMILHGQDIDSFMAAVAAVARTQTRSKSKRKERLTVFTHNLKFDSDFCFWWLLHGHGEVIDEVRENVLYNFTARWDGVEVVFRDSLKIFPRSASEIGELYGIKKLVGEWDYTKYREPTNASISAQEWAYVDHDVMIISRALADYRARGYMENTQAAIAYNDRLRFTYPGFHKTQIQRLKKTDYEQYRRRFPYAIRPLSYELHDHLLLGYYGGISYLNPMYANQDLKHCHSYDVHSMYPDKMANGSLPYGDPLIVDNPTQEEAWRLIRFYDCVMVDWVDLSVRLKSADHFPVLMFKTNPHNSIRMEGKIIRCEKEVACLTGIDVLMMESEYEIISGEITRLYLFRSQVGQYAGFVNKWMTIKSDADRIRNDPNASADERRAANTQRSLAKVMLNASYGKDGTKLLRYPHKTYLDPDTDLLECNIDVEVGDVEYYLPTAIFICALARRQLWRAVKILRREFIYCDTDSVKVTAKGKQLLEASPDFEIDDYKLGAWGYEGEYITAKFVRQKTYSYEQVDKHGEIHRHYVVCGAPDDIKAVMDIDEFTPGMVISLDKIHACTDSETGKPLQGRLLPVRCKGGVILEETGFQISKYDNWDEANGKKNMPIDYALLKSVLLQGR